VARRRSRKAKKESWLKKNEWAIVFLVPFLIPFIIFPWLAVAIFSFLFLLGVTTAGLTGFVLALGYALQKIANSLEEEGIVPLFPASYSGRSRYSERAVIEDTKIMIRKVDRRRGIKKEAYMRKRRIEVTREVNDLDLSTEPERGWGNFPWNMSEYKDEDEENW
jgi:nitrate reductase NapE component